MFRTRQVALAAYAIHLGGHLQGVERGEFVVAAPWSLAELAVQFASSPERRFDDHIKRLRDLKRSL